MDTANVVMEMVVQRLDDLSKEEKILQTLVWERIMPFAARAQFATYHIPARPRWDTGTRRRCFRKSNSLQGPCVTVPLIRAKVVNIASLQFFW